VLSADGVSAGVETTTARPRPTVNGDTSRAHKSPETTTPWRLQTTWPQLFSQVWHTKTDSQSSKPPAHGPTYPLTPTPNIQSTPRFESFFSPWFQRSTRGPGGQVFSWLMTSNAVRAGGGSAVVPNTAILNRPQSSSIPERPRISTGPPVVWTSQRIMRPITSPIPIPHSPSPGPGLGRTSEAPNTRPWLTSAPIQYGGGKTIHCQVQLANDYLATLNVSGSSSAMYGRELGAGIAWLCRVDESRISDVGVFKNPETGRTFLRHIS